MEKISLGLITQLIFNAASNLQYDVKSKREVADDLYELLDMIDEHGVKVD